MTLKEIAAIALDEDIAQDAAATPSSPDSTQLTDLQKHDAKYHPKGYKEGDKCKYRELKGKGDLTDQLDPENVEGDTDEGAKVGNKTIAEILKSAKPGSFVAGILSKALEDHDLAEEEEEDNKKKSGGSFMTDNQEKQLKVAMGEGVHNDYISMLKKALDIAKEGGDKEAVKDALQKAWKKGLDADDPDKQFYMESGIKVAAGILGLGKVEIDGADVMFMNDGNGDFDVELKSDSEKTASEGGYDYHHTPQAEKGANTWIEPGVPKDLGDWFKSNYALAKGFEYALKPVEGGFALAPDDGWDWVATDYDISPALNNAPIIPGYGKALVNHSDEGAYVLYVPHSNWEKGMKAAVGGKKKYNVLYAPETPDVFKKSFKGNILGPTYTYTLNAGPTQGSFLLALAPGQEPDIVDPNKSADKSLNTAVGNAPVVPGYEKSADPNGVGILYTPIYKGSSGETTDPQTGKKEHSPEKSTWAQGIPVAEGSKQSGNVFLDPSAPGEFSKAFAKGVLHGGYEYTLTEGAEKGSYVLALHPANKASFPGLVSNAVLFAPDVTGYKKSVAPGEVGVLYSPIKKQKSSQAKAPAWKKYIGTVQKKTKSESLGKAYDTIAEWLGNN